MALEDGWSTPVQRRRGRSAKTSPPSSRASVDKSTPLSDLFASALAPTTATKTTTTATHAGQNDYQGEGAALSNPSDCSDDGILTPTQGSVFGSALHADEAAEVRDEDAHAAELDLEPKPICVRANALNLLKVS